MPEPEATPEFQATAADLSPYCPSPLHSAAPAVVPALQDTADILDAMTAHTNGVAQGDLEAPAHAPISTESYAQAAADNADAEDDVDSLDDAYGEEEETHTDKVQEQQVEPDAGEDDYLKIFDSPPRDADQDGAEEDDVSKAPESIHNSAAPDSLTSPSQVAPSTVAAADSSSATATAAEHSAKSAPSQPAAAHQGADSSAPHSTANGASFNARNDNAPEDDPAVDISRLVAEMTGQASESSNNQSPTGSTQNHDAQPSSNLTSSASATLPPRPPLPQQAAPTYPSEDYRGFPPQTAASHVSSNMIAPPTSGQPSAYVATGAPGAPSTASDVYGSLPPPPANGLNAAMPITSMNAPPYPIPGGYPAGPTDDTADRQKLWDTFVNDERRYMADAKWDKFPDGSRIFIGSRSLSSGRPDGAIDFFSGNLSSERVSKRDVFDIFHRYGRLAQISLKSAYGFVQYHNLEDAQAAMDNLQGSEIKGRKIHLEISRAQKKKDGNERNRSPDRGGRGGRQSGRQDRHDGANSHHDNRRNRDDYRPGRNSPPRRGHGREDSHGRDRYQQDSHDHSRGRSRSPQGYGRHNDGYRRRSPSPPAAYGRPSAADDRLDIPRRYGNQVPDVQFLLLQDLSRDFITWVQRGFTDRGLKVDVMFLHPSFPREAIVQRQVIEGVHAIVDLDIQAQNMGKIPLRVFDRSGGVSARYDDYRDIDPPIAAELVLRAKSQAVPAAPYQSAPPPQPQYPGYGQPYGGQHVHPQAPAYHGGQGPPRGPPVQQPQPPAIVPADLASMMSGIDNATLQRLLVSLNPQGGPAAVNNAAGAANAQLQALMGGLRQAPPAAPTQPASYGGQAFAPNGAPPPNGPNGHPPATGTGDSAVQVQNIMAQLARYRQ
ncbi:RNA recognition domain-containing protein [Colletotrichum tamarilloi]|uniref:RNA recognition domain-containing protein n=1 Tax=Colletotrichum tamarilloi TaxID=1209934 RepID=A0ABQ9RHZ7_9PEZI|nr:RNA recognition domain-containing protein [Colletotrichum tamarilloi]KAK1503495.1 RNA recognition domain-containing protein [Colletotrichum tamarilloi]